MLEDEAYVMRQFGRAFKLVEGWIEAQLLSELQEVIVTIYGESPEQRLAESLLNAKEPLPLYAIAKVWYEPRADAY